MKSYSSFLLTFCRLIIISLVLLNNYSCGKNASRNNSFTKNDVQDINSTNNTEIDTISEIVHETILGFWIPKQFDIDTVESATNAKRYLACFPILEFQKGGLFYQYISSCDIKIGGSDSIEFKIDPFLLFFMGKCSTSCGDTIILCNYQLLRSEYAPSNLGGKDSFCDSIKVFSKLKEITFQDEKYIKTNKLTKSSLQKMLSYRKPN